MFDALIARGRPLRTWLLVRLGLWRGQWRRGRLEGPGNRFLPRHLSGGSWNYGLYAPGGLRDEESAPLVLVLHGCKQRALRFAVASGWTAFADAARVRLLCPEQRQLANLYRCWNWFHPSSQFGQGEVAIAMQMIDEVARLVRVDEEAIAAVGVSAGGALAALLGFHFAKRLRAVIAVSAPPLLGSFNVQSPYAIMQRGLSLDPLRALGAGQEAMARLCIIHGSDDEVVNPLCADQLQAQALESYRRAGHPARAGAQSVDSTVTTLDYVSDKGELALRRINVAGLAHEWTGGPGGHRFCERPGAPLTSLCGRFLRDAGLLARVK